jgi:soluble lytic murein transglycosylase-like protein
MRIARAILLGAPWLLVLLVAYGSFAFPIKPDRYAHGFREHVLNRLIAYADLLRSPHRTANRLLPLEDVRAIVESTAERYGVEPCLAHAVTAYESSYWPNAISTTGAMGLMALMPETATQLGVADPFDPRQNVDGGVRHLRELSDAAAGDVDRILAAYNAGLEAVVRAGGVPPFRETRDYVAHVGELRGLCRLARGLR